MAKRIPDETKQLMRKLYADEVSIAEIARRTDVSYTTAWRETRTTDAAYPSRIKYETEWVIGKGFVSYSAYLMNLAMYRKVRPQNQALSSLIKNRLRELGKNRLWLAQQLGVSVWIVYKYGRGEHIPNGNTLKKLFSALEVPYKTIDDLLEDNK